MGHGLTISKNLKRIKEINPYMNNDFIPWARLKIGIILINWPRNSSIMTSAGSWPDLFGSLVYKLILIYEMINSKIRNDRKIGSEE